jgi:hypothetical protein
MEFAFEDITKYSGYLAFAPPTPSESRPLLLVTDAGHDAVAHCVTGT